MRALAVVLCLAATGLAEAQVARVIDSRGLAMVERAGQAPRLLGAGEALDERDVVSVTRESWVIVELLDGTRITLRPNTVFRLDSVRDGSAGGIALGLAKGGARVKTGATAAKDPGAMKIRAGTAIVSGAAAEYDLRLCGNDCAQENRVRPARPVSRAAMAGRVVQSRGSASVRQKNGVVRSLVNGLEVMAGDAIVTGTGTWVAVVFRDGTRLIVGAASRFELIAYRFDPRDARLDRFAARLAYGSVRTRTGEIAKRSPESFALFTGTRRITPLGTEFAAGCSSDCAAMATNAPVLRVAGGTWVTLEGGQRIFLTKEPANHRIVTSDGGPVGPYNDPVLVITQPDGTEVRLDKRSPGVVGVGEPLLYREFELKIEGGGRIHLPRYSDEREMQLAGNLSVALSRETTSINPDAIRVATLEDGSIVLSAPAGDPSVTIAPGTGVRISEWSGEAFIVEGGLTIPVPAEIAQALQVGPPGPDGVRSLFVTGQDGFTTFVSAEPPYRRDRAGGIWVRLGPGLPEAYISTEPANHRLEPDPTTGEPSLVLDTPDGGTIRLRPSELGASLSMSDSGAVLRTADGGEITLPRYSDERWMRAGLLTDGSEDAISAGLSPRRQPIGTEYSADQRGGLVLTGRDGSRIEIPPGGFVEYSELGNYYVNTGPFSDPPNSLLWLSRDADPFQRERGNIYIVGQDGMPLLVSSPYSYLPQMSFADSAQMLRSSSSAGEPAVAEEQTGAGGQASAGGQTGEGGQAGASGQAAAGAVDPAGSGGATVQVQDGAVSFGGRIVKKGESARTGLRGEVTVSKNGAVSATDTPSPDDVKVDAEKLFSEQADEVDPGLYVWAQDGSVTVATNGSTASASAGGAVVATSDSVEQLDEVPNFMRFDTTPPPALPTGIAIPDAFRSRDGSIQLSCRPG
jgi:hypothetical protein